MIKKYIPKDIPGMIEPVEQEMLQDLASKLNLRSNDCIVEFGTFFGRSTACISLGLIFNPTFKGQCRFYAYDSFECELDGGFYQHVNNFAKNARIENLLEFDKNRVNFYKIFEYYNNQNIESGNVIPVQSELSESYPKDGNIKLIHIDSPKFYNDFKYIFYRFFPKLQIGSYVVFQDFFYHWSASLIAICGLMIKEGFLTVEKTAASSLCCKVEREFNLNDLNEIDLAMDTDEKILNLIEYCKVYIGSIEIDRKEIFLPRLTLAKIQYLYEKDMQKKAAEEIIKYFKNGNKVNINILNDFLELIGNGFSIRRQYEKDHNIK
jgi:hypothetical protein